MPELYRVEFENGDIFVGGTIYNSRWNKINKPIKRLIYNFPTTTVVLEGYECYNHLIEHKYNLVTKNTKITSIILLSKSKNIIRVMIYNLKKQKLITHLSINSHNWNNTAGWKDGIRQPSPLFKVLN